MPHDILGPSNPPDPRAGFDVPEHVSCREKKRGHGKMRLSSKRQGEVTIGPLNRRIMKKASRAWELAKVVGLKSKNGVTEAIEAIARNIEVQKGSRRG